MLSCGAIQHGYVYDAKDSVIIFEPRRRIVRFTKNVYKCEIELLGNNTDIDPNNLDSYSGIGELICECYGVFGVVQFLQGSYLVVITEADLCGCINYEHDVYTIKSKTLVPLFNGSETTNE
uniref:Sac domain-containing inositol phosphatase 3, putative n=1 Tax=Babesia bovis TaxID=5865 RepID=S6B8D3_BABBO|nr:Sac domain-containing inositol phosphatase 3, putative [Babesia bovis]